MDKPEDKKNYKEIAKANKDLVRRLSEIHCSLAEISHITGISKGTLEKKYTSEIELGKARIAFVFALINSKTSGFFL